MPSSALRAALVSALSVLALSACRFQSARAAYAFAPGVTQTLRYEASLEAGGGARAYGSSASARLSFKTTPDSAKNADALSFTVDSLAFRGSDRDSGEGRYMAERLRKYRARLLLTPAGQILSLEEEPALPPVDFSTLDFGRWLLYGLPAFPAEDIGTGSQWTAEQPLLDKFHPDSKAVKTFTATALRKTAAGRLLTAKVSIAVRLEDLAETAGAGPELQGRGETVFNIDKGRPVSVDLEMEGDFLVGLPRAPGDTTASAPASKKVHLKQRLRLDFDS